MAKKTTVRELEVGVLLLSASRYHYIAYNIHPFVFAYRSAIAFSRFWKAFLISTRKILPTLILRSAISKFFDQDCCILHLTLHFWAHPLLAWKHFDGKSTELSDPDLWLWKCHQIGFVRGVLLQVWHSGICCTGDCQPNTHLHGNRHMVSDHVTKKWLPIVSAARQYFMDLLYTFISPALPQASWCHHLPLV